MTGDEKRELFVYSEAWRYGHGEGFGRGWEDGFEAGKEAFKQRVLDAFDDNDDLPEKLVNLLRAE